MKEAKAATADTTSKKKHAARPTAQRMTGQIDKECATERTALHRSYGQIGISAVAAAARYQGAAKNPAYAPAPLKSRDGGSEAIA